MIYSNPHHLHEEICKELCQDCCPHDRFPKRKFENITWTSNCHANFMALKKVVTKALVFMIMDPLKSG